MAQATPTRMRRCPSARTVTGGTILFMVLLRVAVGWHFFYEGYWKLFKADGKFSATPYLQASVGPFSDIFHGMVDDMSGMKKRLVEKQYLYDKLDEKLDTILKHYGADQPNGLQDQTKVDNLEKKANGGLTDAQRDWIGTDLENQKKTVATLEGLKAGKGLNPQQTADLERASKKVKNYTGEIDAAKTKATALTPKELAELDSESRKLTKSQVESLKDFVDRKKHGVPGGDTLAKLFDDETLFKKEIRNAGEYVKPMAPDQTDFVTEVVVTPIPEKRGEIVERIKKIIAELDDAVRKGVKDEALGECMTATDRLGQLELLKNPLPDPKIAPEGTSDTDTGWITREYVLGVVDKNRSVLKPGLLDLRYDQLRKAYDLTDDQHQSKYGWRYRDQKKLGHHDINNVDYIESDPDFVHAREDYKLLIEQIGRETGRVDANNIIERNTQANFDDQRLVFNTKKRDTLRSALLTRVEAPLGDVDLKKMQEFSEYIGPIKRLTAAQVGVGPVPMNAHEFDFIGKQLTRVGIGLPKMTLTYYYDIAMMLGLLAVGACLMIGLFTRFASLGGAVMLLMFYLAMPPFPGVHVPENAAEGHYLFVNKNLIEMLVLLMFAFSGIGRWFGLDAFIHAMFGRKRYEAVEAEASAPAVAAQPGRVYIPQTRTTSREG